MAKPKHWMMVVGLLLVMGAGPASAEKESCCRLLGRIISAEDGVPLRGASVQLDNLDSGKTHQVLSDEWGEYSFEELPRGEYGVKVSRKGFVTLNSTVQLRGELEVHLNFLLRSPDWAF